MTSSIQPPRAHRKMAKFQAKAVSRVSVLAGADGGLPAQWGGRAATHWVLLEGPSEPGYQAPPPPKRPSDYLGQIIAVPAEPEPVQQS
jgi:hypothetical protein